MSVIEAWYESSRDDFVSVSTTDVVRELNLRCGARKLSVAGEA